MEGRMVDRVKPKKHRTRLRYPQARPIFSDRVLQRLRSIGAAGAAVGATLCGCPGGGRPHRAAPTQNNCPTHSFWTDTVLLASCPCDKPRAESSSLRSLLLAFCHETGQKEKAIGSTLMTGDHFDPKGG